MLIVEAVLAPGKTCHNGADSDTSVSCALTTVEQVGPGYPEIPDSEYRDGPHKKWRPERFASKFSNSMSRPDRAHPGATGERERAGRFSIPDIDAVRPRTSASQSADRPTDLLTSFAIG